MKEQNLNITVKVTKIPGAKVMAPGQPATTSGVFIPIDNKVGVCRDGYKKKLPDGGYTTEFLNDVELTLTGYVFREPGKTGCTHGLKPCISSEMLQGMLEEQIRKIPWVGFVTPWSAKGGK